MRRIRRCVRFAWWLCRWFIEYSRGYIVDVFKRETLAQMSLLEMAFTPIAFVYGFVRWTIPTVFEMTSDDFERKDRIRNPDRYRGK